MGILETIESPADVRKLDQARLTQLAQEVRTVRSHGIEVLLFRPGKSELWIHGIDLMRPDGLDRVAQSAYEAASTTLFWKSP